VIAEGDLVRFGIKPGAPVAQFVHATYCDDFQPNRCGCGRYRRASISRKTTIHRLSTNRVGRFGSLAAQRLAMTDPDLMRFLDAQDQIYAQVVDELTKGRKQTHWMWFIFPQLAGLGRSVMAQHYAVRDIDQARRYLADPILGTRLHQGVRLLLEQKGKSACEILGSPR
jgi:Protein of unknown function (DUF1810)